MEDLAKKMKQLRDDLLTNTSAKKEESLREQKEQVHKNISKDLMKEFGPKDKGKGISENDIGNFIKNDFLPFTENLMAEKEESHGLQQLIDETIKIRYC